MFVNMAIAKQSGGNIGVDVMDPGSQHQQLQQEQSGSVLPGFRFHPTDEELVAYYLRRKVMHIVSVEVITQLNIYDFDPWDLPKMSVMKGEKEWYFFCPRDRKYRNSARPNRVTEAGFWKATGTDRPIYSGDAKHCIGLKKSLVFYTGRAAKSSKTDWMMHEFRMLASSEASIQGTASDEISLQRNAWAVCRIFKKCTLAQRHAPPLSQWATTQPQQVLADATAQNFVLPVPFRGSECASNEHDSSSPERSDTTSEEVEVECTPQDLQQNSVLQSGYATAGPHLQQPQRQEQSASTPWISTMTNGMGGFHQGTSQGTSSATSNMVRQRLHIPGEMNPLEMAPNNLFVQDSPPMRGGLEYGSCIIFNPPQSATQFVDRNFDNCNNRSRESLSMSHHQNQPVDNIGPGSVGPRMNSSLGIFRNDLAQQFRQQLPQQPFFSTQPWD